LSIRVGVGDDVAGGIVGTGDDGHRDESTVYSTAAYRVRRRMAVVPRSRGPGVLVHCLWLLLSRVPAGRFLIAGETGKQRDSNRVLECRECAVEAGCGVVEAVRVEGGRMKYQFVFSK